MLVRVSPEQRQQAIKERHVRPFGMAGRSSRKSILIDAQGIASDADLKKWIQRAVTFAKTLPAK